MPETITLNGRTMTFAGTADHATHGEGVIFYEHFDPKPGEVVFDVGASDSLWTLYALASGATVYAFEPSRPQYQKLVEDVLLNEGFFERAHLHCVGLDVADSVKTLGKWYGDMGGYDGLELTPDCHVPTRFLPLDHYLPELTRLDWIKVDVEAGELLVLTGGVQAIEKFRPRIILENHSTIVRMGTWMLENQIEAKMHDFLRVRGYEWVEVPHHGRSFIVAGPR